MFHNIHLKIKKMKGGESVKLSIGENSSLVVVKAVFTMLRPFLVRLHEKKKGCRSPSSDIPSSL